MQTLKHRKKAPSLRTQKPMPPKIPHKSPEDPYKIGDPESTKKDTLEQTQNKCKFCNNIYKHSKSLTRHMKTCYVYNSQNHINIQYKNRADELEQEVKWLRTRCKLLENKYDNSCDNLIDSLQKPKTMPNIYTFVNDKYVLTPPIEKMEVMDVPTKLKFIKNIMNNKNGDIELCEIILHHISHNTMNKFIGDHIIQIYKNPVPSLQPIWTTDCSRLNYIIRQIVDQVPSWTVDTKGTILTKNVIEPILSFIKIHLTSTMTKYLTYILKNNNKKEVVSKNVKLLNILTKIENGVLAFDIIKYLAPHFSFDKKLMNSCEKKLLF